MFEVGRYAILLFIMKEHDTKQKKKKYLNIVLIHPKLYFIFYVLHILFIKEI